MKQKGLRVMGRLVVLVRPLTGYMCLAVTLGVLGHLCAAAITVLGGVALLGGASRWLLGSMLLCALFRGLLRYGEQQCNHDIAFRLLALIRDRVFGALRRLCPAKLEGRDKGDLISLITSDIELLEVFYAHTVSPLCIALIFGLLMVLFLGSYHWALGLLAAAAYVTVGVLIPLVTAKLGGDLGLRFRAGAGELSAFVLDSLRGLDETIQFGAGNARMEEMNRRTDAISRVEGQMKGAVGCNTAVTNTVILLFDLVMLLLSAALCPPEGAVICTLGLMSSFGPAVALAALGATLQNTLAAGERVLEILDEEPVAPAITGKDSVLFQGAQVDSLRFGYGEKPVLDGVSVTIPKNQIIGICGSSGSGKSTLLKLLMRFWQTQGGSVEISGRRIEEINTADLRNMESYMTQQTHLFSGSIRSNLLLVDPDATRAQLEEACKKASIHDFICALPRGYDTPVGELGDTLSGGERQRLGLARAFLHGGEFLLLDEPTSNLDSLNEAVILRSLDRQRAGRTVVLVSHRSSTMTLADTVYQMERGKGMHTAERSNE